MYNFKHVTIDKEVYDLDISGYVKYTGYAIPVMHDLSYYSERSTVKIDGTEYTCPYISKLSIFHRNADGELYIKNSFAPVDGIWVELKRKSRKDTGLDSGYYGRIIVYDSTEEAIRFLEMLRDKLYSTPFYIETTKWKTGYYESNKYYAYRVDINKLNSFIEDLRNRIVEFPVEHITTSIATGPIKPEPVTEQPKRVTWRWSV